MFEQTILNDSTGARKKGALAASFMAQIVIGGVLLLVPLVFTEVLPAMPKMNIVAPSYTPPSPPPPDLPVAQPQPTRPAPRSFQPVLVAPREIPVTVTRIYDPVVTPEPQVSVTPIPGAIPSPMNRGVPGGIIPPAAPPPPESPKQEPEPVAKPIVESPVTVSGALQAAKLIRRVLPAYPPIARQTRAQGIVLLRGIIGIDGRIRQLDVVQGSPLLTQAALDAVRQWEYSPTILSGRAVEVETTIEVNFQLQ